MPVISSLFDKKQDPINRNVRCYHKLVDMSLFFKIKKSNPASALLEEFQTKTSVIRLQRFLFKYYLVTV